MHWIVCCCTNRTVSNPSYTYTLCRVSKSFHVKHSSYVHCAACLITHNATVILLYIYIIYILPVFVRMLLRKHIVWHLEFTANRNPVCICTYKIIYAVMYNCLSQVSNLPWCMSCHPAVPTMYLYQLCTCTSYVRIVVHISHVHILIYSYRLSWSYISTYSCAIASSYHLCRDLCIHIIRYSCCTLYKRIGTLPLHYLAKPWAFSSQFAWLYTVRNRSGYVEHTSVVALVTYAN